MTTQVDAVYQTALFFHPKTIPQITDEDFLNSYLG